MRISDWSSDVCSSDLLQRDGSYLVIRKRSEDVTAFEDFLRANRHHAGGDAKALAAKLLGRHPDGPSLIAPTASDYNDFDFAQDDEIGRASCRERVGQYE